MRDKDRANGGTATQVLVAALVSAAVAPLCFLIFARHLGEPTLAGAAAGATAAFAVVAGCAWAGGRYGFLVSWVLILASWSMIMVHTITDARREFITVMTLLPDGFLAWSIVAVPLAFGTALSVRGLGSHASRTGAAGAAVWFALLVANSLLSRYAPDVGNSPRQNPVLASGVGVPSLGAPILVSSWIIWRLRRSNSRSTAVVSSPTPGS